MVGQPQSTMHQILWVLAHKRAGMSFPELLRDFIKRWPAELSRRTLTTASIQHIWTRYRDDPEYNQDWAPDQIAYILGRRAADREKVDIVAGVMARFPFYVWPQYVLKTRCLDYVVAQHGGAEYDRDWDKQDVDLILEKKSNRLSDEDIVKDFFLERTLGRELGEEEIEYVWARYRDDPEYSHHFKIVESIEDDMESAYFHTTNSASEDFTIGERGFLCTHSKNLRDRGTTSTTAEYGVASIGEERPEIWKDGFDPFRDLHSNSNTMLSELDPAMFASNVQNFVTNPELSFESQNIPQLDDWRLSYPYSNSNASVPIHDSSLLTSHDPETLLNSNAYTSISPLLDKNSILSNARSSVAPSISEATASVASAIGGHGFRATPIAPVPPPLPCSTLPDRLTISNSQLHAVMETPFQLPGELMYLPPPHDSYYYVPHEAKARGWARQVVWDAVSGGYFLGVERVGSGEGRWVGLPLVMLKLGDEGYLVPNRQVFRGDSKSMVGTTEGSGDRQGVQNEGPGGEIEARSSGASRSGEVNVPSDRVSGGC